MSLWISWCSTCVLAVMVCAMLKPSQSQDCSTEKMENTTIDIKAAISKGIKGADPIHVTTWKACVDFCCLERKIAGNKPCNYVVFSARRKSQSPNCYLFYYPMKEICPMKEGLGLVTYRIIRDAGVPEPSPSSTKVSHPIVKGSFLSPEISSFDLASPGPSRASLKKTTAFKRKGILGHVEKYLDKIEEHPNGEMASESEDLESSPVSEISSLLPSTIANTVQFAVPTIGLTAKHPVVTTGTYSTAVAAVHPHGTPSSATAIRPTTAYHQNSHQPTVNPSTTTVLQSPMASVFTAINFVPLPSSTPRESLSVSLPGVHLSSRQSSEGAPARKEVLRFGDKSILLTALLFGVILLLLVTVLVGRMMLESLQKRRYTRLDYLINGMYANM
nr:MANSC domain-containing protein 1 [Pogona vitticeps]